MFWLRWILVSAPGLSLVTAVGSFSLVTGHGLLTVLAPLVLERGL